MNGNGRDRVALILAATLGLVLLAFAFVTVWATIDDDVTLSTEGATSFAGLIGAGIGVLAVYLGGGLRRDDGEMFTLEGGNEPLGPHASTYDRTPDAPDDVPPVGELPRTRDRR